MKEKHSFRKERAFITQTLAGKLNSRKYENVMCNIKHLAFLKRSAFKLRM